MALERRYDSRRILVTGASGFVGGRVVEAMRLSGFAKPVGTIRGWTRAARPGRQATEVVVCDICQQDDVRAAVKDVQAIVHCAYTDDRDSIVGGTRNLLEAAVEAGVEQFVFLSSAEVYDTSTVGQITESSPTESKHNSLYKNCKIEAEHVCREFYDRLAVTILRPSLIYGPFGNSWSIDVAERLQSGKWGLFDERDGICNLVYVDDVVGAIFASLQNPDAAAGESFNLNGPDKVTWNDYFEQFNDVLGLPPLTTISVTHSGMRTKVMDLVGKVADAILARFEDQLMEIYLKGGLASNLMKKIKGELDATPTGTELNDLYQRQFFLSTEKIEDKLGFRSQVDLQSGMRRTAAWLELHEKLTCPLPLSTKGKSESNPSPTQELVSR